MNPVRLTRLRCLLPATCCVLLVGCAKVQSTVGTQATEPVPTDARIATDVHDRLHDVDSKLAALDNEVASLPGSGSTSVEAERNHRTLMRNCFARLAEILPLLEGPQATGEFQQTLRIIDSSRGQLANGSMDLAAEPTIDTGLRALSRILAVINRDAFGNDADLGKATDGVRSLVNELDTVRGPIHRVVVGQTMTAAADVLHQMSQSISDKAGPLAQPATQPTTQPVKQPDAGASALAK